MRINYSLRAACPEDAVQIVRIHEDSWIATYPDHSIGLTECDVVAHLGCAHQRTERLCQKLLRYPGGSPTMLVAQEGCVVLGFLRLGWKDGRCFVYALYVDPSRTGVGVGSALLREVIRRCETGMYIELNVARHNHRAKRFYRTHGFQEVGRGAQSVVNGKVVPNVRMKLVVIGG